MEAGEARALCPRWAGPDVVPLPEDQPQSEWAQRGQQGERAGRRARAAGFELDAGQGPALRGVALRGRGGYTVRGLRAGLRGQEKGHQQ